MAKNPVQQARATRSALKFFDGAPHKALSGHIDRYRGIRIDDESIAPGTSVEEFRSLLTHTLGVYR